MFHFLDSYIKGYKKQYTIVWCIVFSFLYTATVSAFADTTTFTILIDYGLTGNLLAVGPSGIVIKDNDIYFSGQLDGFVSATSLASVSVSSSRSGLIYVGPTNSVGSFFSYVQTGDDGHLFWTGNALSNIASYWYEYYPVSFFKDSTPPIHSGTWSYLGDNIHSDFHISWSPAIDTGVGDFHYTYSMLGISGLASGYILSTSTNDNSLSFGPELFFPGEYSILITAVDALGNISNYSPQSVILSDSVISETGSSSGGGGTSMSYLDVCLCGDYSLSFSDYRCAAPGELESNYVFAHCSTIYSDFSGGTLPVEFIDQWGTVTDSFLNLVSSLPTAFNVILELPNKQLILSDQQEAYWDKMQIIMQKNYTGDSVIFDSPLIQGNLRDGILYITYIDKPLKENVLCLNCCATMHAVFPSMSIKKVFWYFWWCNPIIILFLLLCLFLVLLLFSRRYTLYRYVKTLSNKKKL